MYFRVLGSVSIDGAAPLTALMQRRLLAALLCKANESVPADELVSALWGADGPVGVRKTLQVYMRRLRLALGDDRRILHDPAGYRITVAPDELDTFAFARLTREGRLEEALGLWRGRAYEDVRDYPPVADEARRLDEERLRVEVQFVTAELEQSRHQELIPRLRRMTEEHPFREDFRGHLMLAFYRAGRHSEALDIYIGTRKLLAEELGVDPGPELQRLHAAILRRAPELDLASTAPRELPADSVEFVGRLEQLAMLDTMLDSTAPVVISAIAGSAGVGKTALAVHWAARVAERFPDGQLYLNLNGFSSSRPLRPIEALASMLRSIGVPPEKVPVDEAEAAALFRTQMSGRRMLVVLDNAKSADQVRPLLPGGSGSLVLVTSRNSLSGLVARDGARRLNLDVLNPDEAQALLAQILGADRAAAKPDAIADLAGACAYLPLALRVAAANLNDRPHRSIAEHVQALLAGDRLEALAIEDDQTTAVRAAFDQSYLDVSPDIRRTFRLLGLIPGSDFTVDTVAALTDQAPEQAQRHLSRLAGACLINSIGPDRYTFHDLLRVYAIELVSEDEAPAAIQRLYRWYLSGVYAAADLLYPALIRLPLPVPQESTFNRPADALAWLDKEKTNLVAAIHHAAAGGPQEVAWLIAGALRGYFNRRRHLSDWLSAAQAGLDAATAAGDTYAQASAQLTIAHAYQALSEFSRASGHLERAIELSRDAGWPDMLAICLGNLGGIRYEEGALEQADRLVKQSLELCRQAGFRRGEAHAITNLGVIANKMGRLSEAVSTLRPAAELCRELGLSQVESGGLTDLGEALHQLGRLDEAISILRKTLQIKIQIGDRLGESLALSEMASVYADLGRHDSAKHTAEAALDAAREAGGRPAEVVAWVAKGSIALAAGDVAIALHDHLRGVEIAHGIAGAPYPRACAALGLAIVRYHLNQLEQAAQEANRAFELARASGFGVLQGRALTLQCRIAMDTGQEDEAFVLVRAALESHRATGYRHGEGEARGLLDRLHGQGSSAMRMVSLDFDH